MKVQAFSHFGICVRDPERSMRFYCDLLGFHRVSKLVVSNASSATLVQLDPLNLHSYFVERDGVRLELLHYVEPGFEGEPTARPMNQLGVTHIALRVQGLDELLDRLRWEGFEVLESTRIDNRDFASSVVFVLDPDGVRVELIEMPGDPRQPLGEPLEEPDRGAHGEAPRSVKTLLTALIAIAGLGGAAASAETSLAPLPAPNPWAAPGPYPMSHHNPAQTDVTIVDGPTKGKKLVREDAKTVPVVWCSAPIVKRVGEHTTVIAGTPHGLAKIDATGEAFELVSFMPYPGLEHDHADVTPEDIAWHMERVDGRRRNEQDLRLLFQSAYMLWDLELNLRNGGSGAYGVIDRDGYHYTFFDSTRLVKSFDDNAIDEPLRPVRHVDITEGLSQDLRSQVTRILGIALTYDGHIAVAAKGGLFVFDRELVRKAYLLTPGEHVENSIAVDEKRIYLVTSRFMRGIAWDGQRLSDGEADGGWKSEYNVMPEGEAIDQGAASHGSGTTPTLMGFGPDEDKLVVISDGDPDGAQLVAFWRDSIPDGFSQKPRTRSRRIADQIRLRASPLTVEASPAAYGAGVIVLNSTYPDSAPAPLSIIGNAFLAGVTREAPRGAQKFLWKPEENRFVEGWFLEDIDNTDWMPPAISPHNGLAYVATKVDSVYEYRAIDFETGETIARWPFPDDSVLWNNWGGITTLLEDGDLLLGGFFAVKRYDIGHLR